jgi:uncharacterized phage-associated protein
MVDTLATGPHNPLAVANCFLERSIEAGRPIDHMKLQKLIYFAQGYYLASTALRDDLRPLVDEYFEAWPYGPVIPSVYQEFSDFGRDNIDRLAMSYDPDFNASVIVPPVRGDRRFDHICQHVWDKYSGQRSMRLSDITHKANGAWDRARTESHGIRGKDIPNEYILDDFRPLVRLKAA